MRTSGTANTAPRYFLMTRELVWQEVSESDYARPPANMTSNRVTARTIHGILYLDIQANDITPGDLLALASLVQCDEDYKA